MKFCVNNKYSFTLHQYNDEGGYGFPEACDSPPPPLPPDTPNSPPVFFDYNESNVASSTTHQERVPSQWQSSIGDSFDEENSFEASIV